MASRSFIIYALSAVSESFSVLSSKSANKLVDRSLDTLSKSQILFERLCFARISASTFFASSKPASNTTISSYTSSWTPSSAINRSPNCIGSTSMSSAFMHSPKMVSAALYPSYLSFSSDASHVSNNVYVSLITSCISMYTDASALIIAAAFVSICVSSSYSFAVISL